MKASYVDLVRGSQITFIAGPFPDEATARKYERAAVRQSVEIDPWVKFDDFGVTSITDFTEPGELNDQLDIDTTDLLPTHR